MFLTGETTGTSSTGDSPPDLLRMSVRKSRSYSTVSQMWRADELTEGPCNRFDELKPELADLMGHLRQVIDTEVASFNTMVAEKNVPSVVITK